MAEIVFACSSCSKRIKTNDANAGRKVVCPNCSASVLAPGAVGDTSPADFKPLSTPLVSMADAILRALWFLSADGKRVAAYQRSCAVIGTYAIPVAGAFLALQLVVTAIKTNQMNVFLIAIFTAGVAFVVHYVAAKFALSGVTLLRHNPQGISQMEFPDVVGFLAILGAILPFLAGLVTALRTRDWGSLVVTTAVSLVLVHVAIFSLNPEACLNVRRDAARRNEGQALLAIIAFLARCGLALAPIALALLAVIGTLWTAVAFFIAVFSKSAGYFDLSLAMTGGPGLVLIAGAAPIVGYLYYLLMMLIVNLCQAVLAQQPPAEKLQPEE